MFNKTDVENNIITVCPCNPENLKLVSDREGKSFVFQLENIISIEPFWDVRCKECDVNLSNGNRIRVCLTPEELHKELFK